VGLLHDDELSIDVELVRRLIADQLPYLAWMPLREVALPGTVNRVFRLGAELCVRLPRTLACAEDLQRELTWLPTLAPRLPLTVPTPMAPGRPSSDYPCRWAVYRWIDGQPYAAEHVADETHAARALAGFVSELRSAAPTQDAPRAGRRPLLELDEATRSAIDRASPSLDHVAVARAWRACLTAPAFDGPPVWVHTDLLPTNLLVRDRQLAAVLDFGGVGVGDPATDLIAAWAVFGPAGRRAFLAALQPDEGAWQRACSWALHQAVMIVPYYEKSNPAFVAMALQTIEQVLWDLAREGGNAVGLGLSTSASPVDDGIGPNAARRHASRGEHVLAASSGGRGESDGSQC